MSKEHWKDEINGDIKVPKLMISMDVVARMMANKTTPKGCQKRREKEGINDI